ncbi:hypothetical protein [Xanthomonas graminis]|uniref:hypothetical protein n=1 Tax=Xanthomonas graminis TaxID=3390026 RepID=UPI0006B35640|nr:hypothetical protein [Xanthomonas translucens]
MAQRQPRHFPAAAKAAAGSEELSAIGFSESDGLEPAETNGGGQPACLRDAAGTLWFPLISGFAQIDPLALGLRRAQAPPMRIQSLDVGGRSVPLTAGRTCRRTATTSKWASPRST